jgi:hypothetical protein
VLPQPITPRYIAERRLAAIGLGDRLDDFDTLLSLRTSVGLEQRVTQEWAKNVRVPTFLYQVRGDTLTDPSDVQTMYDNLPVADKKLRWIEGTTARWDGYLSSSSVALNRCSSGSTSTCPDLNGEAPVPWRAPVGGRRAALLQHARSTCITPTRLSTAGWTASHSAAAPRAGGVRHGQDMPDATQASSEQPRIRRIPIACAGMLAWP